MQENVIDVHFIAELQLQLLFKEKKTLSAASVLFYF